MNYEKNYYDYVNYVKGLNRFKGDGNYYENHHIKPRSLGGDNSKENMVLLTAREHFLAHYLLCKFTKGVDKKKMVWAFHRLCYSDSSRHVRKESNFKMSSRFYEYLRKEFIKIFEDENYRKRCSERSKDRVWINNGTISKMVKNFELENFLKEGWHIGRIMNKSNLGKYEYSEEARKRKALKLSIRGKNSIWVHNDLEDRMIQKDQLKEFLDEGYLEGRSHKKKPVSNGQIGKIAIYNPLTDEEKRIDKKDLDIFLSRGFVKGRRKASEETKQKMGRSHTDPNSKSQKYYQSLRDGISKRKHFEGKIVHKGGVYKGVSLEELDTYLSKGWQIGARPKSEDWKRKARERNQKKI